MTYANKLKTDFFCKIELEEKNNLADNFDWVTVYIMIFDLL